MLDECFDYIYILNFDVFFEFYVIFYLFKYMEENVEIGFVGSFIIGDDGVLY